MPRRTGLAFGRGLQVRCWALREPNLPGLLSNGCFGPNCDSGRLWLCSLAVLKPSLFPVGAYAVPSQYCPAVTIALIASL